MKEKTSFSDDMNAMTTLLLLTVSGLFLVGQGPNHGKKVDSFLRAKNFQGAVLIANQGKILFKRGYGLANAEHNIANAPHTVFRIGSITKPFTAVAILKLQEQGKLNVNDPISKHLKDYPDGHRITIHHLLTHTSGIPSITDLPQLAEIQRHPSTPQTDMAHFQDLPLEFEPGTQCKYSNSGFIVLGAIVEKTSEVSYEKYLHDHVFTPLGMRATYFDRHQSIIPHRAAGYAVNAEGEPNHAEFIDMSFPHGSGALASTVEDLYKFSQGLKERKLLSEESTQVLFHSYGYIEEKQMNYGYGFFIDPTNHKIGHTGSIEGFRAAAYRHFHVESTIILLSNQEATQVDALEQELSALVSSYWRR